MCCKGEQQCNCGSGYGQQGHSCDCGEHSHFERHFFLKEEKIAELEEYLQNLQMEAKAVEERITELRAA
jgi:hypothetical protein